MATKVEALGRLASLGSDLTRGVLEALQALQDQYAEDNRALADRVEQLEATVVALRQAHQQREAATAERIDRQAEIIRALCEGQTAGDAALSEFTDILLRLRNNSVPLPGAR